SPAILPSWIWVSFSLGTLAPVSWSPSCFSLSVPSMRLPSPRMSAVFQLPLAAAAWAVSRLASHSSARVWPLTSNSHLPVILSPENLPEYCRDRQIDSGNHLRDQTDQRIRNQ